MVWHKVCQVSQVCMTYDPYSYLPMHTLLIIQKTQHRSPWLVICLPDSERTARSFRTILVPPLNSYELYFQASLILPFKP